MPDLDDITEDPDDTIVRLARQLADLRKQHDDTRARLAVAERVCTMVGWTHSRMETDRDKALYELWHDWTELPGVSVAPADHPDLSDDVIRQLARKRDATRARVLARLRGDGTDD